VPVIATAIEEWLENKWKDLVERKGTQKAAEVTEIVHQTIQEDNSWIKRLK